MYWGQTSTYCIHSWMGLYIEEWNSWKRPVRLTFCGLTREKWEGSMRERLNEGEIEMKRGSRTGTRKRYSLYLSHSQRERKRKKREREREESRGNWIAMRERRNVFLIKIVTSIALFSSRLQQFEPSRVSPNAFAS